MILLLRTSCTVIGLFVHLDQVISSAFIERFFFQALSWNSQAQFLALLSTSKYFYTDNNGFKFSVGEKLPISPAILSKQNRVAIESSLARLSTEALNFLFL